MSQDPYLPPCVTDAMVDAYMNRCDNDDDYEDPEDQENFCN